jgi:hypothetical protein
MTQDLTLSGQVQTFIESLSNDSDDDLPPEEREETTKARRLVEATVDDIIASREMVTEGKFAAIEKLLESTPELVRDFLDDRFTRDVIAAVPGYVRRTMELSRLEGSRLPSKITNGYLREAVRTYIYGLPQASVALCRAAMEQALKENLGYQGTGTFVKMEALLDEAEGAGVIDSVMRKAARKIADDADDVLHEKPVDSKKAYEVLLALRGVLQHVYA